MLKNVEGIGIHNLGLKSLPTTGKKHATEIGKQPLKQEKQGKVKEFVQNTKTEQAKQEKSIGDILENFFRTVRGMRSRLSPERLAYLNETTESLDPETQRQIDNIKRDADKIKKGLKELEKARREGREEEYLKEIGIKVLDFSKTKLPEKTNIQSILLKPINSGGASGSYSEAQMYTILTTFVVEKLNKGLPGKSAEIVKELGGLRAIAEGTYDPQVARKLIGESPTLGDTVLLMEEYGGINSASQFNESNKKSILRRC